MSASDAFDIVVIGAGAAGVAAARRLRAAGASYLLLEAKDRVGGRAHTVLHGSAHALDLGCGWLHSADRNEWAALAGPLGFTVDHAKAAWTRPALTANFPAEAQAAFHRVFMSFEEKLERAAEAGEDVAAASLMGDAERRWAGLLDAFSSYYNGAPFNQISVKDYAAYQPTDENWRVREGYGALITAAAAGLDLRLSTPVRRIDHHGAELEIETPAGAVRARKAIVAVSAAVLAEERLVFDPALPEKLDAASDLPLGHVEKVFLALDDPEAFPVETLLRGRIDTAETGGYTLRPLGLPVVEGFFGGDLAAALETEGEGAFARFAIDELAAVLGTDIRRRLRPIAESSWRGDPFIRGAYSHARVGRAGARAILAAPAEDRLFFAGEACSPHAFSTAHGAYETGVAAAEAALGRR